MGNVTKLLRRRTGPGAAGSCHWTAPSANRTFLPPLFSRCPRTLLLPRTGISPGLLPFFSSRNPIHPLRNILNATSSQKPSQPFPLSHDTLVPLNACGSFFFSSNTHLYHEVTSSHLAPAVSVIIWEIFSPVTKSLMVGTVSDPLVPRSSEHRA